MLVGRRFLTASKELLHLGPVRLWNRGVGVKARPAIAIYRILNFFVAVNGHPELNEAVGEWVALAGVAGAGAHFFAPLAGRVCVGWANRRGEQVAK